MFRDRRRANGHDEANTRPTQAPVMECINEPFDGSYRDRSMELSLARACTIPLIRTATMGRNVCVVCAVSNLTRAGNNCTSCGTGFVDIQRCCRCGFAFGDLLTKCIHCIGTVPIDLSTGDPVNFPDT
jgi:hypothetical protein